MARHEIRAAKPRPQEPRAQIKAAPTLYDKIHPVGSAERFLDDAAKEALASAAAGGLPTPKQLMPAAVKAMIKETGRYPDPLLERIARLPDKELLARASRAEAYQRAMEAQNAAVDALSATMSPVADIARTQAAAAIAVHQDAKGGDSVSENPEAVSENPETVSENPEAVSRGPRIVINPTTFTNKKDALCVAFNEGFRLWMESAGFEPQSEPTDAQRRFFSDTAYADDEVQLRRTILARIATFDTSVKDPTDDQLSETASFLNEILESDWCRNDWERDCVSRLANAVQAAVGAEPVEPRQEPLEPREPEPLQKRAALGAGETEDDEDEPKNGAIRYVEKDGSYYRQTFRQGETGASSGWQGMAIGKDEWDSAQRNIEKGVSAQRFAEAWDAGTDAWNADTAQRRKAVDGITAGHNEINAMVADGAMNHYSAQVFHNFNGDVEKESFAFRRDDGSYDTLSPGTIRKTMRSLEATKDRDADEYRRTNISDAAGFLNRTRTLDLDLTEDELAKKAALAGPVNMQPDEPGEPQVAETPETSPAPETAAAGSPDESVAETPVTAPATEETPQQGGGAGQPQNGGPALAAPPAVQDEGASGGTSGHTVAERRARHPLRMNGPSIAPVRPIGDIGAKSFTNTKAMNGPSIEPVRPIGDVGAKSFTDTKHMNGPSIEPARPIGTIDTADGSGGSTLRRKKRRRSRI